MIQLPDGLPSFVQQVVERFRLAAGYAGGAYHSKKWYLKIL